MTESKSSVDEDHYDEEANEEADEEENYEDHECDDDQAAKILVSMIHSDTIPRQV